MSVLHRYEVTDPKGRRHVMVLADCLNVQRTPAWRKLLLDRTFHRLKEDGADVQVEKSFVYLDLPRGQLSSSIRRASAIATGRHRRSSTA
jgi:hypothetical protein